ncbi:unnamed protein product [Moneuplotes crassus]|uniref:Uncharacterized protein n=1 Tax=Euplotes crassus TaxID=5936 RepID=A0AAD1UL31_EUPCR|nr:unnamed protein product [Moneuplotes crassus]
MLQDPQDIENAQSFQDLFSEYMAKIQKRKAISMGFASGVISLLTSPLLTLGMIKQLSIPNGYYKTYNDFKSTKAQGSFQRVKNDSQGAGNAAKYGARRVDLPYKPINVNTYMEATHALMRQGLTSFFKGNGIRCLHMCLFQYIRTDLSLRIDQMYGQDKEHENYVLNLLKNAPLLKEFLVASAADFVLHPLHCAEARFVLQHRSMNFCVYPTLFSFFKSSYGEMWRGILLHAPKNMLLALTGVSFINSSNWIMYCIPFLVYPFLTIQRRIECQSIKKGMLQTKYRGFFSGMYQILKNEGPLSLYRGFPAFFLATTLWMLCVPSISNWYMENSPWANQETRDIKFRDEMDPARRYEEYEDDDIDDEDLRAAAKSQ